ncbi:MAG: hypothetical protein U9O20_04370 [Patescibacteria group bacterium]|nr:hypothetical protein [Patescibacteria group bacterium]
MLNGFRAKVNKIQELAGQGTNQKKIRFIIGNAEFHLDGLLNATVT